MNIPAYREKYKIQTVKSPIMLVHSSIHNRGIPEYEEVVVSTSTCSIDELKKIFLYSWSFLTLHSLGLLRHVAEYYNQLHGLPYMKFYEVFLEFCKIEKSVFSEEFERIVKYIDDGYSGKGWDEYDPNLGEINWPIEEASWLRLSYDKEKLLAGINSLLIYFKTKYQYKTPDSFLKDLAKFQTFLLTTRDNKNETKTESFHYDWKNFFVNNAELKPIEKTYHYKNLVTETDPTSWNYKVIWYGRRAQKYKCKPEDLQDMNIDSRIKEELTQKIH